MRKKPRGARGRTGTRGRSVAGRPGCRAQDGTACPAPSPSRPRARALGLAGNPSPGWLLPVTFPPWLRPRAPAAAQLQDPRWSPPAPSVFLRFPGSRLAARGRRTRLTQRGPARTCPSASQPLGAREEPPVPGNERLLDGSPGLRRPRFSSSPYGTRLFPRLDRPARPARQS